MLDSQGLARAALAVLVGLVAALCVSSPSLAAIVGGVTVCAVAVDAVAFEEPTVARREGTRLTVDLAHRRRRRPGA